MDKSEPVPRRTLMRKASKQVLDECEESDLCHDLQPGAESLPCDNLSTNCQSLSGYTQTDDVLVEEDLNLAINLEEEVQLSDISENEHSTEIIEHTLDTDSENELNLSETSETSSMEDFSESSSSSDNDGSAENVQQYSKQKSQMLCVSAFIQRHNLTCEAAKDLEKLLSVLDLNDENEDFLKMTAETLDYKTYHYCLSCNALFPLDPGQFICQTVGCNSYRYKGDLASQTQSCRQPNASFLISNIESQLRQVLEKPGQWETIQEIKKKLLTDNRGVITDITDGEIYRALCRPGEFLYNKNNISAVFNTDGIPLYDSSKVKLWPIFLAINELPVASRFSRDNLLLAGIWQGKEKPPYLQYMWMFGEEMCRLHDVGFIIQHLSKSITVKLAVLCGSVDLQAKAYILNMTMFNGSFGCSTCEEEGCVERQGNGHARCYPYRNLVNKPAMRNSDDVKYAKGPQATTKKRIKGICGISGLSVMPWFDLVHGIVPDYMHGVLMGVTKQLLSFWFSPSHTGKEYFCGNCIVDISERLQNICPPDYIERLPRDLQKHYGNFKATELQTWLLFFSVPCMKGFLSDRYFSHLCLLSEAVYILVSDRIETKDLERAEILLDKFYEQFSELYNKGSCGLNVHNTGSHLVHFVKLWGPLWAWSCFVFEDANAALLQSVHGTGDVTKQCIRMKQLQLQLKTVNTDSISSKNMKVFLKNMKKTTRHWSGTKQMHNCCIAGAQSKLDIEVDEEFLTAIGAALPSDVRKVLRVEVRGEKFYCEDYSRMKRRVCYVASCKSGNIVLIKMFVFRVNSDVVFAVAEPLIVEENCHLDRFSARHIVKVSQKHERLIFPVEELKEKLFYIRTEMNVFVSRMPNMFGHCVFK